MGAESAPPLRVPQDRKKPGLFRVKAQKCVTEFSRVFKVKIAISSCGITSYRTFRDNQTIHIIYFQLQSKLFLP